MTDTLVLVKRNYPLQNVSEMCIERVKVKMLVLAGAYLKLKLPYFPAHKAQHPFQK